MNNRENPQEHMPSAEDIAKAEASMNDDQRAESEFREQYKGKKMTAARQEEIKNEILERNREKPLS